MMAAASSSALSAVSEDLPPAVCTTHGRAKTLQITFFLIQLVGEWGQKHCRSSVRGEMAIGPCAGTLFS